MILSRWIELNVFRYLFTYWRINFIYHLSIQSSFIEIELYYHIFTIIEKRITEPIITNTTINHLLPCSINGTIYPQADGGSIKILQIYSNTNDAFRLPKYFWLFKNTAGYELVPLNYSSATFWLSNSWFWISLSNLFSTCYAGIPRLLNILALQAWAYNKLSHYWSNISM